MRIRIGDQEVPLINPFNARIGELAVLQTQNGKTMPEILAHAATNDAAGIQAAIFLSLRRSGSEITWDASGDYGLDDVEAIPDAIDKVTDDDTDPTSALTASVPVAASAKATGSRPSRAKPGSK